MRNKDRLLWRIGHVNRKEPLDEKICFKLEKPAFVEDKLVFCWY